MWAPAGVDVIRTTRAIACSVALTCAWSVPTSSSAGAKSGALTRATKRLPFSSLAVSGAGPDVLVPTISTVEPATFEAITTSAVSAGGSGEGSGAGGVGVGFGAAAGSAAGAGGAVAVAGSVGLAASSRSTKNQTAAAAA